jgi:NTE family protein
MACLALSAHAAASASECAVPAAAPEPASTHPALNGLRVGLALGSGSMHGLAHIGVIEALEARGLDVKVVSGTSVGAIVGSLWASGLSGRDIEIFARASDFEKLDDFTASWQGLFSNDRLRERMQGAFQGRPIESWPRRFGAVATNVETGAARLLMTGDGAVAVQASTAVPVMFQPVTIDGERLADGALVQPVPVQAARDLGADYVIAVDVAYRPYEEPASGLTQFGFQAMHILINSLAAEQMRGADFPLRLDVHHQLMDCGPESLIAAGREAVRRAWPQLSRSLAARAKLAAKP